MSTTTGRAQVTMEEAIKQLVELAKGYVSYVKKSSIGIDNPVSFRGKYIYVWVNFVDGVWFVRLGVVEVTTNGDRITFPYNYTINDLVCIYNLYLEYLDGLNTDFSKRTKADVEAERIAEIEGLKSKLAQLESGEIETESCPF